MKILVTGSKGQLGSEMRQQSSDSSYHFIFHDIDTLDITDINQLDQVLENEKPDVIINCAAYTAVDLAEQEKEKADLINHLAVRDLSFLAREHNIKLIHISTDYVFDGKHYLPYKENDAPKPQSTYGFSKLKGEYEVLNYKQGMIIRTSWLYSSFGNNFVKTILRLAAEKNTLDVVFDQTGNPTYARDLANALFTIIQMIEKGNFFRGIYHFANEGVCSWYDFARSIIDLKGYSTKINPVDSSAFPRPAPRPPYSVLDKSHIKKQFNISIPYWRDSLKECINKIMD